MMMTSEKISLKHRVVQGTDHIVSDMGREKVMLSISNGKYYNLGAIGGAIWDCISEPVLVSAVVRRLTEEYDVEPSVCEEHVLSFLDSLAREGIISVTAADTP
ncbi:lasso peptide biosynthesis PqqD family chaperone [Paenibacillus sp. N4]|uniref:lasso peptide biosynthesis PqqD family chaperone n=1 Tax=Paenibacillus vietnamensis TaxID=2590547 RepID=UPI001CD15267|nr:lasso peptide biosynthesis PqqD family chaperone [Paenibacillus vietnamensis]MCA0755402.1 lasso peptide biosynthesis PqqD family chaperone [Paenibacillus vietnamensis]